MDLKKDIVALLKKEKIDPALLEIPPDITLGNYALPCFTLAKQYKKVPQAIAQDLATKLKPKKSLVKIAAAGPYLNFFLDPEFYNKHTIESTIKKKKTKNKTITLEYSSPNIMKPFNIAHLRSTMIGNALYHLHDYMGYKVVRINHLGDWGTQFGKMMYAFEAWGDRTKLKKEPIKYMLSLYVKFHKEAKKDSALEEKGREWFVKLEQGDKKARSYWKEFRKLSLKEYDKIYKRLNVDFDSWNGEAFYDPFMKGVMQELKGKNLIEESEGALIVNLEKEGLPPCLMIKSDGATLYATRDFAQAQYRKKEYNFYKNCIVVDSRQSLHFQQVFKVLELAGYTWSTDCVHVPFGLMKFKEGIMSTREGKTVFLEDVLDKATQKVQEIIEEKNPNLKNKKTIAEQVGIGAIIFWDLSHDRVKDLIFDWEVLLDFNGETGPYVQYTHARASSILRKIKSRAAPAYDKLLKKEEQQLVKEIEGFETAIANAAAQYKPHVLARYLIALSQRFNEFYQACPIKGERDKGLAKARLQLVKKTKETLAYGLDLLGIAAPEEM